MTYEMRSLHESPAPSDLVVVTSGGYSEWTPVVLFESLFEAEWFCEDNPGHVVDGFLTLVKRSESPIDLPIEAADYRDREGARLKRWQSGDKTAAGRPKANPRP